MIRQHDREAHRLSTDADRLDTARSRPRLAGLHLLHLGNGLVNL